jgi:hypothetical protein
MPKSRLYVGDGDEQKRLTQPSTSNESTLQSLSYSKNAALGIQPLRDAAAAFRLNLQAPWAVHLRIRSDNIRVKQIALLQSEPHGSNGPKPMQGTA